MSIVSFGKQALNVINVTQAIKSSPFEFAIDSLIRIIVKTIIPIPIASELIIYFKGPILALFLGSILFFITFLFIIFTTLMSPSATKGSFANLLGGSQPSGQNVQQILQALNGYREAGFSDTDTPTKDPFGGSGTQNQTITVNYHEIESFNFDGQGITETEQGIDIIPNSNYNATNKAYKLTSLPIIFDTVTGTTHTYVDQYGANIVEVTNQEQSLKTVYIHMSQVLVGEGVTIHPGVPIGVMGSTGMSTGPHLEYQVRINQGGSWITQNPLNYIN